MAGSYSEKITKRGRVGMVLLKILQSLGEASMQVIDEGFLNPRYSFTKPSRVLLGLDCELDVKEKKPINNKLRRRKIFSTTLYRLKKDGLVQKIGSYKNARWKITSAGEKRATQAQLSHETFAINLPAKDGKIRIVSFDVPEDERWKRDRLRYLLIVSDYKLLHNSVWLGRRPLAKEVFWEINYMKINPYIHVFEISKTGTIRDVA